jgi:hypothetical protein
MYVAWNDRLISELKIGKNFEESDRYLILRYYLSISLEVLSKTTKNPIQNSLSSGRDLNRGRS